MNTSAPPSPSHSRRASRAVTLQDVARAVGVTPMTVSRALNNRGRVADETRVAVQQAVAELGYEPNRNAQQLAGGRDQRTIAILLASLDFDVTLRKVAGIQQQLSARGYSVPLHTLGALAQPEDHEIAGLARELRCHKPRAIVCKFGALSPEAQHEVRRYHDEGGLVVSFNEPADLECDQVLFDREDNTYQAARYLLELGHRDLGFWAARRSSWTAGPRLEGFRRALREFGVSENPQWQWGQGHYLQNERNGAELAARVLALAPRERPTGLCIVNDSAAQACAAELMRACVRVPDDISIVSHDDLPIALYGAIPMTAVSHPIEETARAIVDLLCERIETRCDEQPRRLNLRGELRVRQSTGPPSQRI